MRSPAQWDRRCSESKKSFAASDYAKLPTDLEVTLFHVVQEGLANAHRHSGSSWAKVRISSTTGQVKVSVENEATGAVTQKMGVGIRSMQERVEYFGGTLAFHSDQYRTVLEAGLPFSRGAKGINAEMADNRSQTNNLTVNSF